MTRTRINCAVTAIVKIMDKKRLLQILMRTKCRQMIYPQLIRGPVRFVRKLSNGRIIQKSTNQTARYAIYLPQIPRVLVRNVQT